MVSSGYFIHRIALVTLVCFVNRVSELEGELDNQEKERREEKLKTDERIKILEKKYEPFSFHLYVIIGRYIFISPFTRIGHIFNWGQKWCEMSPQFFFRANFAILQFTRYLVFTEFELCFKNQDRLELLVPEFPCKHRLHSFSLLVCPNSKWRPICVKGII